MNEQEQLVIFERAMAQNVRWEKTSNPLFPYKYTKEGTVWQLRLNDFPEEPLYTLIVNGQTIGSFDDWPSLWIRTS